MTELTNKLKIFFVVIAAAIAGAAAFGALHNQISYTISPEYFTKYTFERFGFYGEVRSDRFQAAIVGVYAAWWVGIPIGFFAAVAGWLHDSAARMLQYSLRSLAVAAGFTLIVALAGLGIASLDSPPIEIDFQSGSKWADPMRHGVTDFEAFVRVARMHAATYMGGALSIVLVWAFHLLMKLQDAGAARSVRPYLIGAVGLPLAAVVGYFLIPGLSTNHFPATHDPTAIIAITLLGAVFVALIPARASRRLLAVLIYTPAMAFALTRIIFALREFFSEIFR